MVINLKLPSDLKIIPEITLDIIGKIKSNNISDDDLFDIRLALEEALVNAVKHGNKQKSNQNIFLKVAVDSDKVAIQIKDEGQGFDYGKLSSPLKPKNLKKPSGRGVFLIKKLMDSVEFFDGGRGIKMVKSFRK